MIKNKFYLPVILFIKSIIPSVCETPPVNINLLEPPMFDENTINGYEELKERYINGTK